MDSYKVIVSPRALAQLDSYMDYIQYTLLNEQAAFRVWQDAMETREHLSYVAESLPYCKNPRLRKYGYRVIRFRHHRYVMIYRAEGINAYVDAIYHELQDYENLFSNELDLG